MPKGPANADDELSMDLAGLRPPDSISEQYQGVIPELHYPNVSATSR
jgi:hypothetical protein